MRTKIQNLIIPRNWIFGRLSYINNNLSNILRQNSYNLTSEEFDSLKEAKNILSKVIKEKQKHSKILKIIFKK